MRAVSGPPVGAVLLAVALLTMPPPPRWRLQPGVPRRRPRPALVVVGAAVPAVILLPLTAAVAVALLIGMVAARRRRRRRAGQRTGEGQALAAALEVLVGELRVGAHPVRAFGVAAEEAGGAVGGSLRAVAARALLGADVAGGLQTMAAAAAAPTHWERLAVCWRLAAEHGLAMSTLMRAAQRDIVERQRFTARVEAGLAGARATAAILAGLPVLGVLLGQLIGARPLAFLLGGGIGGALLVLGVLLICLGLVWSERITGRLTA